MNSSQDTSSKIFDELQKISQSYEISKKEMLQIFLKDEPLVRAGTPQEAWLALLSKILDADVEKFFCLSLNTKNKIKKIDLVSVGTVNEAIVHPREIFRPAIKNNASAIIIAHNHPSGDVSPSKEDIETTERRFEAGKIMGIQMLDHLIVTENAYYSMKENGHF